MLPQTIHILHFCLVHSLLNYAPDFVVNWIGVMALRQPNCEVAVPFFFDSGVIITIKCSHNAA